MSTDNERICAEIRDGFELMAAAYLHSAGPWWQKTKDGCFLSAHARVLEIRREIAALKASELTKEAK